MSSDKSLWRGLGQFVAQLGSTRPGTKTLTTTEQRCAAGLHQVDPQWKKCPYCEAEEKARQRTSRASAGPARAGAGATPPPSSATSPSRRATVLDDGAPPAEVAGEVANDVSSQMGDAMNNGVNAAGAAGGAGAAAGGHRSHTMVDSSPVGGVPQPYVGGGRRLTGVLTTFTWSRLGQLFTLYDGRNYVGSGVVSANNNAPCDVQVTEDGKLSSAHFLILCQGGKTIVSDNFSTNGTFVNGEQIDTRGMELPDNAVIKAGDTLFVFQRIRRPQAAAQAEAPAPAAESVWSPAGEPDVI